MYVFIVNSTQILKIGLHQWLYTIFCKLRMSHNLYLLVRNYQMQEVSMKKILDNTRKTICFGSYTETEWDVIWCIGWSLASAVVLTKKGGAQWHEQQQVCSPGDLETGETTGKSHIIRRHLSDQSDLTATPWIESLTNQAFLYFCHGNSRRVLAW